MAEQPKITFDKLEPPKSGTLVVLAAHDLALGAVSARVDAAAGGLVARAAKVQRFTGKAGTALDVPAPAGLDLARLVVIGAGNASEIDALGWTKIGGQIAARTASGNGGPVTILAETAAGAASAAHAADLAAGLRLGSYGYDRYKTRKKDEDGERKAPKVVIATADVAAARKAFQSRDAVTDGVIQARDLVNAPPNDLGPQEFAKICEELADLGVEVEVLGDEAMRKLGMGALLGVAQGSVRGARLAIMQWRGAKRAGEPIAFIGKGVTFDTGGISIKPAQNMEDMKGDMGGAAAVVGLMRALAGRKAKVNAVGLVGLVENMPDGNAQRPGDIVRSLSGQTIEIINTDAEGRLVLADVLWYCQDRFKPRLMIDLATLTGAIMVALGHEHAGLFANDDTIADRLLAAGRATGERVWRMPLAAEYDKIMDSKVADMKNSGGRNAGAITAAQFLQRFVNDVPWAHLDIAGTAFGTSASDLSRGWTQGFGVRLLDRFVADNYES